MSRFEAAVRSPLSFRRRLAGGQRRSIDDLFAPPETVGIEFEDWLFVWHAFEPDVDPVTARPLEYGPTITVVVSDEEDERRAAGSLQRFLTTIAYYYDESAEAVSFGGSGETDPYARATLRRPRTYIGWTITEPYDRMGLRPEPLLRTAAAYYREGLNAGSPFFRFLAFWNSLSAVFGDDRPRRDGFLNTEATRDRHTQWPDSLPFPDEPARAFYNDSRNAIAHVLRDPGKTTVDPDHAEDRVRIGAEANLLRWIAHRAIEAEYPQPVTVGERQEQPGH